MDWVKDMLFRAMEVIQLCHPGMLWNMMIRSQSIKKTVAMARRITFNSISGEAEMNRLAPRTLVKDNEPKHCKISELSQPL